MQVCRETPRGLAMLGAGMLPSELSPDAASEAEISGDDPRLSLLTGDAAVSVGVSSAAGAVVSAGVVSIVGVRFSIDAAGGSTLVSMDGVSSLRYLHLKFSGKRFPIFFHF